MEKVERFVYNLLKDRIGLKNTVKWIYQYVFSSLPGPRKETRLELSERPGAFFGFHDKSPWSSDGELLLGHTFEGEGTGDQWKEGKPVGLSVFSGREWRECTTVAQSTAWNWQQGAQLQWLGEGRRIVYNDFRGGACVGVVYNLKTKSETILQHPVAAVSGEEERYASICFETFGQGMPAYGYAFGPTGSRSTVPSRELIIREVGGREEARVSLEDLQSRLPVHRDSDTVDFFSHCLFSPDGDHLLFLRRQSLPNKRLRSELFCLDVERHRVHRMPFGDMVSHFTWLSNNRALVYANTERGRDGFYIADTMRGSVANCTSWFNDQDGHPHATPDGNLVVFDTYPDRSRYQRLFIWENGAEKSQLIATFYSPMKFWGPSRVDLHPRLRSDGEYVSFDAGFSGIRSLITARISTVSGVTDDRGPRR